MASQEICGVWYSRERNIGDKMTRTTLLVALMTCTVCFIYGAQSPIRQCEDINQPCALLRRVNGEHVSSQSLCKCNNLTQTNCNENWEKNSSATVTWSSMENRNREDQLKFCAPIILVHRRCNTGEESATAIYRTRPTERWTYDAKCTCQNYYVEMDKREQTHPGSWIYHFVCHKRKCSLSGEKCAERFTQLLNNEFLTTFKYPCVCSLDEQCPPLFVDHAGDTSNSSDCTSL